MSQIPDPKPIGQSMSAAFISQIRQKLQPTLDSVYNKRFSQAKTYVNGVAAPTPTIAAQSSVVTSTGAFGSYAVNFAPVVFTAAPRVVAWSSFDSGGSFTILDLVAVTSSLFQFAIALATSPITVVPLGNTFTVEWIAVGS